jgi:hyperosmotically inducible periplasmic protein
MTRATRWLIAAVIGLAMTSVDCARAPARSAASRTDRHPVVVEDESLVHAFDTEMETRLIDRLELDNFLRDRDIHVEFVDGTASLSGVVWTPLEKERAAELIRGVAGVRDVANGLDIQPPD